MQHLCVFVCVTAWIFGTSDEALLGEFQLCFSYQAYEFYDALLVHQFQLCFSYFLFLSPKETALWFHYVLSPQPTLATLFLVKRCKSAVAEEQEKLEHIEAIWKHKFVNIFDNPRIADLSAYVDFASVGHFVEEASGAEPCHLALLLNCTEEQGYWCLVGDGEAPFWEGPDDQMPIGMGIRYLAIAIVNKKQGITLAGDKSAKTAMEMEDGDKSVKTAMEIEKSDEDEERRWKRVRR
ncbi:hypothetical protein Patl1_36053 [Pistacia atlantica]|nr:hypothetical protein Patl1_36053 [Pistacia atlantica]